MKKLAFMMAASLMVLSLASCGKGDKEETAADSLVFYSGPTASDSLQMALAEQDSLLVIITEINDGMSQIKDIEHILSNPALIEGESSDQRQKLRDDMSAIQEALQQRRERLEELEKKISESNNKNEHLQATINSLKKQIDDQESTIKDLRQQLESAKADLATANSNLDKANTKIDRLNTDVDSLKTTVTDVSKQRDAAQQKSADLTNELNTCYYAVGSKKELKDHKIIESGFLKKTKIMPQDFQHNYFTKADKSQFTTLNLHSKKAKILTNHPSNSYRLDEVGGSKVLQITNPAQFWSLSNYLVVQID